VIKGSLLDSVLFLEKFPKKCGLTSNFMSTDETILTRSCAPLTSGSDEGKKDVLQKEIELAKKKFGRVQCYILLKEKIAVFLYNIHNNFGTTCKAFSTRAEANKKKEWC
jgi:hypothetical protein